MRDNAEAGRYELDVEGALAFATYRRDQDGRRVILHVETPPELRGQGVAGELMAAIIGHARANGLKLRASCSYAVAYLLRHPDARDVMV